jgi:CheY-like chemotaxis protein
MVYCWHTAMRLKVHGRYAALGRHSLRVDRLSPGADAAFHEYEAGGGPAMPIPTDILIIEDDAAIVDFMREVLQDEGYIVRSALDRAQGPREVEPSPPAVILLDVHMPGITTTEFFERLHSSGFCKIPVVIMTADTHATDYRSIHHDVTYLLKPFDLDALMDCVAKFVPPPRPSGR